MLVRILGVAAALAAIWAVTASGQVTAPPEGGAPVPPPATPEAFGLVDPKVSPQRAFFGRSPVRIAFAFRGDAPLDLVVEIVRQPSRRVVRRFGPAAAVPDAPQSLSWDGVADADPAHPRAAPDGRYLVRVVAPGGRARRAGTFSLRGHMYPIRGPHADRGPVGEFGVGRTGGRTHDGFDVNAPCGTPLVAARAGRVIRSTYDPVLYGHDVIIRGRLNNREYRYSHLLYKPRLRTGDEVRTGQRIGVVGDTGNARGVGCHLHFELRRNGVLINPKGPLHDWDIWS